MAVEGAVEVVTEEVASNLEELAQATRRINVNSVTFFLGGLAVGAAVGFYFGHKWNKEQIKAEVFKESEAEVEKIRELYQQKTIVAEPKPPLEQVVEEAGYSTSVVVPDRPLKAPVPAYEPPPAGLSNDERRELQKNDGWNYPEELQNRSEDRPYVIHQDEFKQGESGYDQTTYTYYAVDESWWKKAPKIHSRTSISPLVWRISTGSDMAPMILMWCSSATTNLNSSMRSVDSTRATKRKW